MYALIDANNFFVSCERLFRPDLAEQPVVVLSSNDGCAISRSNEAKALGIPMGAPIFKYRELFKNNGVVCFSGNFALYADISERISSYIARSTPQLEIYSIDESFLDITALNLTDPTAWGRALRRDILRDIGIPVSIGIAPTKTLCKIATDYAKKHPDTEGSYLIHQATRETLLRETSISDIWGIGRRLAPRLRAAGIHTAFELASMRPRYAQQLLGIHGRQLQAELNGTRCLPVQTRTTAQHIISRGRQFGSDTNNFDVIRAAVTSLTSQACRELRREHQLTQQVIAMLRTNRNKPNYTTLVIHSSLGVPTNDAGTISAALVGELEQRHNPRQTYHKAEVMLANLTHENSQQGDLLNPTSAISNRARLVDSITAQHGPHALRQAAELLSDAWRPKRDHLSPRYTTEWDELPTARIKP